MAKRPPTQKEIRERKAPRDRETITIHNISKQLIPIHCKHAPGSDFYYGARDVNLHPGKIVTLPKSRLWTSQISRLQKRRMISIISDSRKVEEFKKRSLDRKKELAQAKSNEASKKEIKPKKKPKPQKPKKEEDIDSGPKITDSSSQSDI